MQLYNLWKDTKERFAIEQSRDLRNVAARAAFYKSVMKRNEFSLSEIGRATGRDHATVIFAMKKDGYNYYNKIKPFEDVFSDVTDRLELKEVESYDGLKEAEKRIVEIHEQYKTELEARLELKHKCEKLEKEIENLKTNIEYANKKLHALGYNPIVI